MKFKVAIILILFISLAWPIYAGKEDNCGWGWTDYAVAGFGAAVAVVGAPVVIGAAGFTGAGIAAGSLASSAMSASATYGVGAGVVATLQSVGAAGFGAAGTAVLGGTGAVVGKVAKNKITKKNTKD